jgi:hypothetical protein
MKCGKYCRGGANGVGVRLGQEGYAGFAGLLVCGSVWACPVCSMKIAVARATEIGRVVANAIAAGRSVGFQTFTMRHHQGQSLEELWGALAAAWASVTSGNGWVGDQRRHQLEGWLRAVEVTWGANGWHVHIHALVVGTFDEPGLEALSLSMWGRWSKALVRAGLDAPELIGSDWQLVKGGDWSATKLGEYLAKGAGAAPQIGRELTMSQGKSARGRHSTRTVWDVVDEFFETGDLALRKVWHEWERVSKGKRQLTWSRGLRELYGLEPELTDEEIALEELGTEADTLVVISKRGWREVVRRQLECDVLEAAEVSGLDGLCRVLDMLGVEYSVP